MTRGQREELERALEAVSARARALAESHDPATLRRRPAPAAWSAAECLDHLVRTAAATVPRVEAALAELRSRGRRSDRPARGGWMGRLLRWSVEPGRFRSRTPAPFDPRDDEVDGDPLPAFLEWQDRLLAAVRAAEGWDVGAARIESPFAARVRYDVFSTFRILETHARRHLDQAERAVRTGGGTSSG